MGECIIEIDLSNGDLYATTNVARLPMSTYAHRLCTLLADPASLALNVIHFGA